MQTVILLMAGSGRRVGLDYNKMMYKINNKRLYQYALEKFLNKGLKVVLVCSKEDYETVKAEIDDNITLVIGGKTRNESVKNALMHVNTDRVMIHDAARTLVSDRIIDDCINSKADAYYVCVPLHDTIRDINNKTLDRSKLLSVQTPQGGKTELFKKYEEFSTTDDVSCLENVCVNIEQIKGDDYNFKITTMFDLKACEAILKGEFR